MKLDEGINSVSQSASPEQVVDKWSRRFGKAFLAIASMVIVSNVQAVKDQVDNLLYEEDIKRDIAAYIILGISRYGIIIGLPTGNGETEEYRYVDSLNMLKWTHEVLSLYPDEMIKDRLDLVSIGDSYGDELGSYLNREVSVDLNGRFPRLIEEKAFKLVLIHELQHFFDHDEINREVVEDKKFMDWQNWNMSRDRYDYGYSPSSEYPFFTSFKDNSDGFVFGYQKKSPTEDRAVTAQILFGPQVFEDIVVAIDPEVQTRLEMLRDFYCMQSRGKMDDSYWEDYKNSKVGFRYWIDRDSKNE